jgi:Fe-S oxidoreductase
MFRQEIPLMYPEDTAVQAIRAGIFDPFEYLMHRHKARLLNTDFKHQIGRVAYHAPCHQRVQNIGPKTRDFLNLIPGTSIEFIERCSGHNGTYGVRRETFEASMKIAKPAAMRAQRFEADFVASDCPMAADHLAHAMTEKKPSVHPLALVRQAYGL